MNTHTIELTGYCAKAPDWPALYLGTAGSYGNEELAVTLGEGWQGLTVSATFQPAGVTVLVSGDGTLDVPWEATETALDAAKGRIVFEGVTDGRVLISADIPYEVGRHSDTEGSNSQPPTPSQWQQFVDEVKSDADRAESASKDAEATLQDVKDAGTQAVTDIGAAKDSALEAIDAAREEAAGSISTDVEGAKRAAADAEQSAADAEQSAKDAAGALANVQAAGKSALDDIATERQNTLSDIQNEGAKQQSAVAGAGTAALEAIGQTEQAAINQIKQTGETQVGAVQSAGTTQISQINSAGAAQVQAVKDEGAAQTSALDDAAAAHKTELEAIASHPPQPNTATGKWQTWNAETGAYQDTDALYQGGYYTASVSDDGTLTWQGSQEGMPELPSVNIKGPKGDKGDPGLGVPSPTQSDAGKVPTVKADGSAYELAGPYAPLSAAIRPTASGNPVNITDSVEWPLQGLKVYGKSTQVTTTGANLANPADLSVDAASKFVYLFEQNPFEIKPGESYSFTFYNDSIVGQAVQTELRENGSNDLIGVAYTNTLSYTNHDETPHFAYFRVYFYDSEGPASYRIMLNAGPTALPWEPYTGGKPSPSPEYPQPIVSAGDGGSIGLTVSNGASLSQSMTISTPNSLPGIPVNGTDDLEAIYVDDSGNKWYCDDADCNGKLTSRVTKIIFDGSSDERIYRASTSLQTVPVFILSIDTSVWFPNEIDCLSNQFIAQHILTSTEIIQNGYMWTRSSYFGNAIAVRADEFNSEEEFRQHLSSNPLEILVNRATPIETPIPPEELAAYRALHTYDGATVVSTAEDVAGLDVRYVADAQKYIDNRLTAAESHIQEIAAAQLNAQTGG